MAVAGIGVALAAAVIVLVPLTGAWWQRGAFEGLTIAAFAIAALNCLRRGRADPIRRWAWWLQGLALVLYLAGSLYAAHWPGSVPIPSPADALWLGFYLLTYASIVIHARARCRTAPARAWLDGMIGGLAFGAVAAAVVLGPLLTLGDGGIPAVATSLTYPIADLVLVLLIVCVLHAAPASTWPAAVQIASLAALLVGDVAFLLGQANGTWVVTSPYRLGWTAAVALLGLSALIPEPSGPREPVAPRLLLPMAATAVAIALLVYGQWQQLTPVAIALAVGTVILALVRVGLSVEEVRRLTRTQNEARYDPVTGLPNRRELTERVALAICPDGSTSLAMLSFELAELREIRQSLGDEAATQVLTTVANRIDRLRATGWIAARIADDGFAVAVPDATGADAEEIAELIRREVRRPMAVAEISLSLTAAVGIASAPDHGRTAAELLTNADLALQQAKAASTRIAAFRPDPSHPTRMRLMLRSELAEALRTGQIVAHLQPQIELATGRIVAVEALARWDHPTEGPIAPEAFLHLAQEAGLMSQLTGQMIDHAAAALLTCARHGHPIGVSVNISAADLADDALVIHLDRALSMIYGNLGTLTVEVTEDSVMVDRDRAADVLRMVRAGGARVSVDDYGTGQASLAYLRDLPLDELKLDRSFVDRGASDRRRAVIVQSTVDLAHELGLSIVAEGVEDDETAYWLQAIGCDLGQGYHFARPMPLSHLLSHLDGQVPV